MSEQMLQNPNACLMWRRDEWDVCTDGAGNVKATPRHISFTMNAVDVHYKLKVFSFLCDSSQAVCFVFYLISDSCLP